MVSTFTPNVQFEEPARGDQVGVWDTPVNNNMTLNDLIVGGTATISLNNSNVVLSAAQFQAKTIIFNSTLTGSVTITFPTSFKKSYEIYHACTGSSAFIITLQTTAAPGGNSICGVPGQTVTVINDGTSLRYVNFGGPVGSYLDYAGASVPNWITGCSINPYLNCNGTTFSSGTYPALATILGSTTLPDSRGYVPMVLNQGTGRTTAGGAGVDGNTIFATGNNNGYTLTSGHLPTHTSVNTNQSITMQSSVGVFIEANTGNAFATVVGGGAAIGFLTNVVSAVQTCTTVNSINATYTNATPQLVQVPIPVTVSGIRMIRSA